MFASSQIESLYNERLARYVTAMGRGTPDRIPVRFLLQEVAGRYMGYTTQQVALDYNLAFSATRKLAQDLGVDSCMLNAIWSTYDVAKAASWKYLHIPGVDVTGASVSQFSEPEKEEDQFILDDEYEEFTRDPHEFLINKWMSRAMTRVKPMGAPVDFNHNVSLMGGAIAFTKYMNAFGPAADKLKYESGIVGANAGMLKAPLDIMGDKLRGFMNVCYDAIDRPDELRRACEALMPHLVANALAGADPDKNVPVTVWAHRGCVPFISPETFDTIFWPTMKPCLEELINKGHQVLFYAEGNWEYHYDRLLELPAGGIIYHLDKGDPALLKRKLGSRFPLSGGLSYDVLARGDEQDVKKHMKELFGIMKDGGGYILDATALMMNDVKPENLKTAVEYTMEHGVYSQGHAGSPMEKPAKTPQIPRGEGLPPLVSIPWEEESAGYRCLEGDVDMVKRKWQEADSAVYSYIWTSLLW